MKSILSFIDDYLNGKPVYPTARKLLSFLFSISITSFIFERLYFKYTLLEFTDYKGILDFFVKGYFFVPFCIYVIVHYSLDIVSDIAYNLMISIKADKWRRWIFKIKYKKSDSKKIIKAIVDNNPTPFILDERWLFSVYQQVTNNFSQEQWTKMLVDLEKAKRNNLHNLQLAFKAIIAVIIYFANVPYFGWKLFSATVVLLLLIIAALYFAYLSMEVLPLGIQKIYADITAYFAKQNEARSD
jgi:hypothetical protein